jgi:hypothetical protein
MINKAYFTIFFFTATLLFVQTNRAQVNTYSPYSRYGLGELVHAGFGPSKALGGTGAGLRIPNQINYLNPASYSSQDTLSFLFDVGVQGINTEFSTSDLSDERFTFNMNHLAISFPIARNWYSSFGLMPYSNVGYDITERNLIPGSDKLAEFQYQGTGGLNTFYFGNSIKIGNHIAVGVNAAYLFGVIEYQSFGNVLNADTSSMAGVLNTSYTEQLEIRDFIGNAGVQLFGTIADKHKLVLGATFEPENNIRVFHSFETSKMNPPTIIGSDGEKDTLSIVSEKVEQLTLPLKASVGLSYHFDQKFLVTAEYNQRDWSKYSFLDRGDKLNKNTSYRFGFQYTPNPQTIRRGSFSSYIERTNFRIGTYFTDTYLQISETQIKDFGISFGLGLPFGNTKSKLHLTYQYGNKGTTENNLIKENYGIFTVGINLYDMWFYKPKFD